MNIPAIRRTRRGAGRGRAQPCRLLLFWLLLCAAMPGAHAAAISLESDTALAREGYLVLAWNAANATAADVVLQQSLSPTFQGSTEQIIPDTGSHTLTGLGNGVYYFRAGNAGEGWSNTVSVTVAHHSLVQAWAFFLLGLVLFIVLCGTIVRGTGKARRARR
jgi:hypothetical protein